VRWGAADLLAFAVDGNLEQLEHGVVGGVDAG
jgi:hypothetical protein